MKSSLISLCLNHKTPYGWSQRIELPIQPSILQGVFFLLEIKQMLNNKQVSMTLQLNAFLSESKSLPFLDIVIFNSQPKADHKVFTGVCLVVFTGAPQQGVSTLAPGVLASWMLPATLAAGC